MPDEITIYENADALTDAELTRQIQSSDAAWLVSNHGPSIISRLARFAKESETYYLRLTALLLLGLTFTSVIVFVGCMLLGVPPLVMLACFCWSCFGWGSLILNWQPRASRRNLVERACQAIANSNEITCIGPLIDVMQHQNKTAHKAAQTALKRLLPRLQASDRDLLTPEQITFLYSQLGYAYRDYDSEWVIPVLQAVGEIGNEEVLPRVYVTLRNSVSASPIRSAAQSCYDKIEARTDWGDVSQVGDCLDRFSFAHSEHTQIEESYKIVANRLKLTHLLQQLQPAERFRLSQKQRRKIHAILKNSVPTSLAANDLTHSALELARAGLQAVRQMRDTEAIAAVRALAEMEAATMNEKTIRSEARKTLRVLEEEAKREAVSGTLLRASESPQAGADQLLRAAQAGESHTDANQLLRADRSD